MDLKKTVTTIFMVPTLKIDREKLTSNNFLNAYIKDKQRDVQYENAVYLLFKPSDMDNFASFLSQEHIRTNNIIDDYDYEDGLVVIVYKLDDKYKRDFELVRHGRYSLTSEKFQAELPKIVKLIKNGLHRDELSLQYRIFKRTDDIVKFWEEKLGVTFDDEQEVWGGFFEEDEILDLDKIRELKEA
jgi:hypothetical protein